MKKLYLYLFSIAFSCFLIAEEGIKFDTNEVYPFDDFKKEIRFNKLTQDYRCPKCQSSNLAGSNAPIAKDLKIEIHRLITDNKTDEEITRFLAERYGDFILYEPPFNTSTSILWLGPFFLMFIVLLGVGRFIIKNNKNE
jgi:cytochrome c-type biogenesis protein CcmH|tara:strand:- start:1810 stop:2226 length:417 start_codon:yes stop_codon:yes gene_type:complete